MYIDKNQFEIITLAEDIKVFGLSHKRTGIPMFDLWQKIDEIRENAKHIQSLETRYGIWVDPHPNSDYFVGIEITSFEGQNDEYSTYAIPAGRYIRNTFNAENIEQLLCEKVSFKYKEAEDWANKNGLKIDGIVTVEAYPNGMFEARYPEMSYLSHIFE